MKVTVCFGAVRVVVPCGDGNGSVRELMLQAATRYSKVTQGGTGWGNDSWVTVHSLKSSDGGLLDPDDRLSDVVDDREQIVAVYEERGGDAVTVTQNGDHQLQPFSRVDIEVTGDHDHSCSLQVRRGSEPALNQLCPLPQFPSPVTRGDASKRWSAAPIIDDDAQVTPLKTASCDALLSPPGERGEPSGDERGRLTLPRLTRDSNRLSMQILGNSDSMWRWADAADRVISLQEKRWEPVGGSATSPDVSRDEDDDVTAGDAGGSRLVVLSNVTGPLGIHMVPESDSGGAGGGGVLVQRVDPGGAVAEDGRVQVGDRISRINGHSLVGCDLQRAQELFSAALSQGELRLSVTPGAGSTPVSVRPPAPVYPSSQSRSQTPVNGAEPDDRGPRVATVPPTKKVPASLSSRTQTVMLASNTRKLGRRLQLQLVKGAAGLGFSVTTRDNPAGAHAPVYVKTILPKGAAIEDGRLRPGDRLLEINGVSVTGLGQQRVVHLLRAVSAGEKVTLEISRHDQQQGDERGDEDRLLEASTSAAATPDSPALKTPEPVVTLSPGSGTSVTSITCDGADVGGVTSSTAGVTSVDRELMALVIDVKESERAGLGVSVKGKTCAAASGPVDAGIYIKAVMSGGAASRDGRLQHDDQIVDVGGCSLLGLSNARAMEALRRAMAEGPQAGTISLTIARKKEAPHPSGVGNEADSTSSLLSNGSVGEVLSGWSSEPPSSSSAASRDTEVTITHRRAPLPTEPAPPPGRNPVVDRLTGRNNARNDSYYLATQDSWAGAPSGGDSPQPLQTQQVRLAPAAAVDDSAAARLTCPTVNMPSGDTVVIECDPPPTSLTSQQSDCGTDVAYASQTSLDQAGGGFARDQLGRQSISEKRHASKDAKNTDTYQRTKRAREEREQARRRIEQELDLQQSRRRRRSGGVGTAETARCASHQTLTQTDPPTLTPSDVGPSLGMKKSSSLESLQTMVHELTLAEEGERVYPHRGPVKVVRGRGCNESFRAAVDRSYEAPLGDDAEPMETVDEEAAGADPGDDLFSRDRTARQSSLSSGAVEGKKNKGRRSGLLKGLGNMFRFGRHRKSSEAAAPAAPVARLTAEELRQQQEELNRIAARRRAEDEERRVQQQQQQRQPSQQSSLRQAPPPPPERSASRPERVQQLREQHQRRHASRQGQYRTDGAEERAELLIRQAEEGSKPQVPPPPSHLTDRLNNNVPPEPSPSPCAAPFWRGGPLSRGGRSSEYFRNHRPAPLSASERAAFWRSEEAAWRVTPDPYEASRWSGSRSALGGGGGGGEQPGPRYGHHPSYDESQHAPRRQHQVYHSQRGGRADPRGRVEPLHPLSGFYEYESVQAVMRLGGGCGEQYSNRSLPRYHERRVAVPPPPHGMKHAVSASMAGMRRPQHLGIPPATLGGGPYCRRGSEGGLRAPHRPPPPPPPLSPPGSRV